MILEIILKILGYVTGFISSIAVSIADATNPIAYDIVIGLLSIIGAYVLVKKFWKASMTIMIIIVTILIALLIAGIK